MKRFPVKSITREKEYDVTSGEPGSRLLHFSANLNGEAETVSIILKSKAKTRKLKFDIDFADLAIKGRGVKGNMVSKFPVSKVELKHKGISTLDPQKIWFDGTVQRLNIEQRGELLGEFAGDDKILIISQTGEYQLLSFELSSHFPDDLIVIEKFDPQKPISAVYWDGSKSKYFVKRFLIEPLDKKVLFISEKNGSYLEIVSSDYFPLVEIEFSKLRNQEVREPMQINLNEFISLKGYKAQGNTLTTYKVKSITLLDSVSKEISNSISRIEQDSNDSSSVPDLDDDETPQIEIDF
jgi:topoisomerase-4 subunit A